MVSAILSLTWLLQDFFGDLDKFEDKHKVLVESSNFLIEVVTETVATEIKQQVVMLNQRWGEVSTHARRFVQEVTVEKCRQGYDTRVTGLTQWLDMAESSLHTPVMCTYIELRDRVQLLEVSGLCSSVRTGLNIQFLE